MSDEITHNYTSGLNLYACRFLQNGDVFITDGSSSEDWGTAGHGADVYDVEMTEESVSGHYKASFDLSANIGAGIYNVTVYKRLGGNPANGDTPLAQGEIVWNGTDEVSVPSEDIVEGTLTQKEAMRLLLAVLTGLTSGGGTDTLTFRDIGDTKDRLVATVDRDGNRTFIIKDVS
ncbi:hypothetical protein LCGC14_1310740 [marine sediment metagenome]|uniref:Uncharacterized protein n=1 Tax=marine sediment metagenome TaxID=412755 RepID=A0A0F9KMI9_9ZZZZ